MNLEDIDKLSNADLIKIIKKYKIAHSNGSLSRDNAIQLVKTFFISKMNKKQTNSDVKNVNINRSNRQRRMSSANSTVTKRDNIPTADIKHIRDRRMSQPTTTDEKKKAQIDHELKNNQYEGQKEIIAELNKKMPLYDKLGIYPPQKRLIAIGDVHGDLKVTLISLKLAGVIDKDIHPYNFDINKIEWIGGSTWIVQTGDQIDRCRPDD